MEQDFSPFYIRLLTIGFTISIVLSCIFAVLLIIMRKLFSSQSQDLLISLKKLRYEIAERDQQLEQLAESEISKSKEIARLRDEFIFIAAHELRAPVAAIEGNIFLFLADERAKGVAQDQREILEDIRVAASRLSQLVIDLLNVSRIESGTIRIAFEKTSVEAALASALREVTPLAEKQGVRLLVDMEQMRLLPQVMGDLQRLEEVFANLLSNAIKYNLVGGAVEIQTRSGGDMLEIAISDTGVGMSEEEMQKLFTKFWRANTSVEGTGLGLWIVKQIVEKMHGSILVESVKGEGSTFRIALKVVP